MTSSRLLTQFECATISRLGRGLIFKDIALEMGVSLNTAETWGRRAYQKLGARNAAHAVSIDARAHRLCR